MAWRLLDEQNRELVETVYNYCRANATSGVSRCWPSSKAPVLWEKALTIGLKYKEDIYTLLYQASPFYVEESFIPDLCTCLYEQNWHSI